MTSPQLPAGSSLISPAAVHPPSLANARRKIFTQREFNSYWVTFFVDRQSFTCRISPSARLFNQTCRLFRLFTRLPRSQVRVGAFSPHARSQTPARCLFRTREGSNLLLLRYVRPMGCLFNQTSRFVFRRCLPRGMAAMHRLSLCMLLFMSSRGWTSRVRGSYTPPRVCLTRRAVLSPIDASCKGGEEAF